MIEEGNKIYNKRHSIFHEETKKKWYLINCLFPAKHELDMNAEIGLI